MSELARRHGRGLFTRALVGLAVAGCGTERTSPESSPDASPSIPDVAVDAGPTGWQGLPGERLGPLPAAASAQTTRFMTSDACAFCHAAEAGSTALRDAKGRDVSPVSTWRSSMMALSARDPYYLAVLEHELEAHPAGKDAVLKTCTRCHAPAANVELAAAGDVLEFATLTAGTTSEVTVGRDGVTCTVCHQIKSDGLGSPQSFTGGYVIGDDRRIFGPHEAPFAMPMQQRVGYVPTAATHMTESGLCGSCHTVETHALDATGAPNGPAFLEQGPFVEWSVSAFAKADGQSCQSCHVPTTDDDGQAISTLLSTRPANRLAPRSPFGRHLLVGANAFMLRVLASQRAWAGYAPPAEELLAQADRAEASLRTAARVSVVGMSRDGAALVARVRVENLTGHKLPTAYPSRRMWLHVKIVDETGTIVFESGGHRGGRIVDAGGRVLDRIATMFQHRRAVTAPSEVQVWEAVPVDAKGAVGRTLLDASAFVKDNRLLPRGFDAADPRAALARPVGVDGDADFGSTDDVEVRVAGAPARGRVEIALLYQTIRPAELELLAEHPGPAALRFLDMVGAAEMKPIVMARTSMEVQ